jgi:D-glycero-alpha-D-manno-heptose-7-phosphate kinase
LTAASEKVRVMAPCRADLAGGTLDIWPIGILHPGSVTVSMAIPVEVELVVDLGGEEGIVTHRDRQCGMTQLRPEDVEESLTAAVAFALAPEGRARVTVISQAPLRSGVGGSSAYGIALARGLAELLGRPRTEAGLVALIRDLEARLLQTATGEQDHWSAVRGGLVAVHSEPGGNRIESLDVAPEWVRDRAFVYFSGNRHQSGMVNWRVVRRRLDGDRPTCKAFAAIAEAAVGCRVALLAGDEAGVGEAIRREWKARRRLAPEVSTPELDDLVRTACEQGAMAAKACGAGGGGSVVVWHPPGLRESIVEALDAAVDNGRFLSAGTALEGCRIAVPPGSTGEVCALPAEPTLES